jgi:hypothetical protein
MAQVATLLLSQRLDATTGNLSVRIEALRLQLSALLLHQSNQGTNAQA